MSAPPAKRSRCELDSSCEVSVAETPATRTHDGDSLHAQQVRLAARFLNDLGIVGDMPNSVCQVAFQQTVPDSASPGFASLSTSHSELTKSHHFDKALQHVIDHTVLPCIAKPAESGLEVRRCDVLPVGWTRPLAKYCLDSGFLHLVEVYFGLMQGGTLIGHEFGSEYGRLQIPSFLFRSERCYDRSDRDQIYIDPGARKCSLLLSLILNTSDPDDLKLLKQCTINANEEEIAGMVRYTVNRIRQDNVSTCGVEMLHAFEDVALCMYVRTRGELDLALSIRKRSPNGGPSWSPSFEHYEEPRGKRRVSHSFLPNVELTPEALRELTAPLSEQRAELYQQTSTQAAKLVGQVADTSSGAGAGSDTGSFSQCHKVISFTDWERSVAALKHVRQLHSSTFDVQRIAASLQRMQEDAYLFLLKNSSLMSDTKVLIAEAEHDGVKTLTPHEFVTAAHCRALQVSQLAKAFESKLRHKYQPLLADLPPHAVSGVSVPHSASSCARVQALMQLVSRHAGEVVEVDRA